MQFDANNKVIQLCAQGMNCEGEGNNEKAMDLFQQAWDLAKDDFEKFIAAHYIARHQNNVNEKLKWDEMALILALKINDETVKGAYPSLYLNIARCYEDLKEFEKARENYYLALSFTNFLLEDGYGRMIKSGILNGIERTKLKQ